jgi:phospholipid-binding lipoprotein MlaA
MASSRRFQEIGMVNKNIFDWRTLLGFSFFILLCGCVSTREALRENPDPFEPYNRIIFKFNDKLDKAILKPVAKAYKKVMPTLLDEGVTNVFSNMDDVIVFANDLLQAKFNQAAMDSSRIVYNTVFGLGGFFDVATYMGLPKHEEDFGQTLGYWTGVEGYFIVVPLFGPSTTRDIVGTVTDNLYFDPTFSLPEISQSMGLFALKLVDTRADLLRLERAFGGIQIDPYAFQREAYLQHRRNQVYDGNPPKPELDFENLEDLEDFENPKNNDKLNGNDSNL